MTVNHWVGGSIPPIPATRSVEQLAAQLTVNQPPYGIGGSNPFTPTKTQKVNSLTVEVDE